MSSNKDDVTPSETLIGRVKWFNNKAGYGFITVTDGSKSGSDIFVHHSAINVENQQYKYLVQGEYVEFQLTQTTSGTHEWQATQVNGIKGGKLMCETRHEFKLARTTYKTTKDESEPRQQRAPREPREPREFSPRQQRAPRDSSPRDSSPRDSSPRDSAPRARGEGPRNGEKKEWTLVKGGSSRTPRQSSTVNTDK